MAMGPHCFHFRLNGGFGVGFVDGIQSASLLPLLFFFLYRSLLLALSLCRFHFRLIGGFRTGFRRRNSLGVSAPSPFLYLYLSPRFALSLPEIVSLLLLTEWRLRSRLSMECIRLKTTPLTNTDRQEKVRKREHLFS
jgi:hypothetical protein